MADYIKREAVHAAVSQLKRLAWQSSTTRPNPERCVAVELDAVHAAIIKIPAEDVRPVVYAAWVPSEYPGHLTCSNCHDAFVLPDWPTETKWRFCPNCGADMMGGGGNE